MAPYDCALALPPAVRRYNSLADRIRANIVETPPPPNTGLTTPCWIWQGSRNARGYGWITMRFKGIKNPKKRLVHRLTLVVFRGYQWHEIEYSMHKCSVKQCCSPDHLDPGTRQENVDYYHQVEKPRMAIASTEDGVVTREPGED